MAAHKTSAQEQLHSGAVQIEAHLPEASTRNEVIILTDCKQDHSIENALSYSYARLTGFPHLPPFTRYSQWKYARP